MKFVADTHSLIWYLTGDSKLSSKVKSILRDADNSRALIIIPCIVFFELLYLEEKKKLSVDFRSFINMIKIAENYKVEPLCLPIIENCKSIPREKVPDPWDRLIAATSLHLKLPLLSKDEKLREAGLEVIW